jgi:hypothetical protein
MRNGPLRSHPRTTSVKPAMARDKVKRNVVEL